MIRVSWGTVDGEVESGFASRRCEAAARLDLPQPPIRIKQDLTSRPNVAELWVMPDFLTTPAVQAGLAVVVLCVLIAAGFSLVRKLRDYSAEDQSITDQALANLQEIHLKGDISDAEFRTIQARTHQPPVGTSSNDDSPAVDDSSPNSQS